MKRFFFSGSDKFSEDYKTGEWPRERWGECGTLFSIKYNNHGGLPAGGDFEQRFG